MPVARQQPPFTWSSVSQIPAVLGIVNVTPDSFSDGGQFLDPEQAVAHARELVAAGADLLDIGGESTRPGARPLAPDVECARILPVIERLSNVEIPICVDTRNASTAHAALAAGARVVNDISGGTHDPRMFDIVASHRAGLILMHMQGTPETMQVDPRYDDVLVEVTDWLGERIAAAEAAGILKSAICADPGIGFGKTTEHNVTLLAGLAAMRAALNIPIAIGTSRKRFLGTLAAPAEGDEPSRRDHLTIASVVWSMARGADIVRVHDVAGAVAARSAWRTAKEAMETTGMVDA
ncbi:MAG: dihydropteroate synthase [Acidimicrobiia bacterium]